VLKGVGVEPIVMFERAAVSAVAKVASVGADQWSAPTPCTEWDVRQLVDHMHGGPAYLLTALGSAPPAATDEDTHRAAVSSCLAALRQPDALERRCMSPPGFEWTVAEATAGIVGPAVAVPPGAFPQDRLLGAMGRQP
jgi:uncharacterized protein (TIGR03083 family)